MLVHHAALAEGVGTDKRNIFIAENGSIVEVDHRSCKITAEGYVLDSTIYELKVVDHETTTATLGNVKEKIPDTGIDSNNSPLYIGLIGGAALVCAITLGVHNRRKAKR